MPETRYAHAGGVTIAYQQFGEGIPLVWVPGFISHVELNWEAPFFARAYERSARFARLVTFDKRGTGLSDHSAAFGSFEERMDDITAVMDAVGYERAVIGGMSEGGPLALLFAATYPERVEKLLLYATWARATTTPGYPIGTPAEEWEAIAAAVEVLWGSGQVLRGLAQGAPDPDVERRLLARFEHYTATPRMAAHIIRQLGQVDVRDVLASIRVPTLVMQSRGDPVVPLALGRYLAEHIPGCDRLVELPGAFHASWRAHEADAFVDGVEDFVTGTVMSTSVPAERVLTAVLFTDIVDSTARAEDLGDAAWREVLDAHDGAAAQEVDRHRGRVIKSTGDGVFATFDGPARAVRCAQAIAGRCRRLGLEVRSGVHVGECEARGDDLSGIAVHVAARVMALAGPGEVWTTRTVKDLSLGSGLEFDDRGAHRLKGIADEVPVLVVRG